MEEGKGDLRMIGTNKHKELNGYVSTFTQIFLNQKRINVCEHTTKMTLKVMELSPVTPLLVGNKCN